MHSTSQTKWPDYLPKSCERIQHLRDFGKNSDSLMSGCPTIFNILSRPTKHWSGKHSNHFLFGSIACREKINEEVLSIPVKISYLSVEGS